MARSADEEAVQDIKDPKARKEAYYTRQRQNASVGSSTAGKISKKLGWGGEARAMGKDLLQSRMASGPWSIPGGKAAEAVEGAVGGAAKALGSGASRLAKRAGGAIEEEVQHLRNPTPVKKALGSSKPALTTVKQSAKGKAAADARRAAGKPDHWFQEKSKPGAASKSGEWHHEPTQAQKALPAYKKNPNAPKMSTKDIISNRNARKASAESKGEVYSRSKERTPRITTGTKPKTFNRDGSKNTRKDTPVNTKKSTAKSKHMDEWSQ